jgi:hypothetical protein
VPAIVEAVAGFLKNWSICPDVVIPMPPSKQRSFQPVVEIASELSKSLGIALDTTSLKKTKGTLTNVINLLDADKKVLLYVAPKKQFFNPHTFQHLHQALNANGIKDVPRFLTSLGVKEPALQHLPFATLG